MRSTGPVAAEPVDTTNQLAALLLLADARLPSGAHAHSFGLEAAVSQCLVEDLTDLGRWIEGCLHSTWLAEASAAGLAALLASGACADQGGGGPDGADQASWALLDTEIEARIGSVHGRRVSRTLGRQLMRTGRAIWAHPSLAPAAAVHLDGPTAPLALGAVSTAAGADPGQAALLSLHHAVQSAGTAAIRLLGLDPFAVARLSASLGPSMTALAHAALEGLRSSAGMRAGTDTSAPPPASLQGTAASLVAAARALPAPGAPMLDVLLTQHQHAKGRLFAS